LQNKKKDGLHESWVLTTQILTTGRPCDCQMARSRQLLWTRLWNELQIRTFTAFHSHPVLSPSSSLQSRPSRSFSCDGGTHMPQSCFACFHARSQYCYYRCSVLVCCYLCLSRERLSGATAAACKCFCNLVDLCLENTQEFWYNSSLSAWMWESSQLSLLEIPLWLNVKGKIHSFPPIASSAF
jgi:hypothetical protein